MKLQDRALGYIRTHPGCTVAEIVASIYREPTRGDVCNMYPRIRLLEQQGLVRSYRLKLNGPKHLEACDDP